MEKNNLKLKKKKFENKRSVNLYHRKHKTFSKFLEKVLFDILFIWIIRGCTSYFVVVKTLI